MIGEQLGTAEVIVSHVVLRLHVKGSQLSSRTDRSFTGLQNSAPEILELQYGSVRSAADQRES